uniref:Uncharacterized protein n=1 Tax=Nelumbo nucifera TaxID=4432 RepID=A0A822XZE7_NELNU|nr:TPA_asm: hypothetical protein HUJ06_025648 [Nelumbo nucifera]
MENCLSLLAPIACNGNICTCHVNSWKKVLNTTKDRAWGFIKDKFDVSDDHKECSGEICFKCGNRKNLSKVNKNNRALKKINHYAGTKSLARIHKEAEVAGEVLDRATLFKRTHTRKDGKPIDDASVEIMAFKHVKLLYPGYDKKEVARDRSL